MPRMVGQAIEAIERFSRGWLSGVMGLSNCWTTPRCGSSSGIERSAQAERCRERDGTALGALRSQYDHTGIEVHMRLSLAAAVVAISATLALGQNSTGGGGSTGGGSAPRASPWGGGQGSKAAPAAPGAAQPGAPAAPTIPLPGRSAAPPGPPNSDPQRSNVDVNPPTNRLPGKAPSVSDPAPGTPATATPQPERAQPGAAASRPGAAQSANSDGYDECMSMWSPSGTGMSREAWSETCNRTRLPSRN
jgi:hypothetical protein